LIAEPFAVGDSIIHRTDPRLRILAAAAFSFVAALSKGFPTLTAALVVSILLAMSAQLHFKLLARRLLPLWGFLLLLWLALPLTYEGETLHRLGPLSFSRQGLELSAQITLKSHAILLALTALAATMSFVTLGHALNRLRAPEKLVHLMLLTYRYIFVLEGEYGRLLRAARVRGFQPGTNLHTYRTYAYLIGMLFLRAADRAQRVHRAMRCRGFQGRFHSLYRFKATRSDWIGAIMMTTLLIGMIYLEWTTIAPL
jgi:cobalt/nickel transport system permease protein